MTDQEQKLFEEWRLECPELIPDGLVDEAQYSSSPRKLLFLMKEVNGAGVKDLRDFLHGGGRPATWDNIARWVQGLHDLDREYNWAELERDNDVRRLEMLKKICAVNVKKVPGGHTSEARQIHTAGKESAEWLRQQISIYQPELVICCGTERDYSEIIGRRLDWHMTSRGILYLREPNRVVISYAHPEARVRDCLLYYGVVDAVKELYAM